MPTYQTQKRIQQAGKFKNRDLNSGLHLVISIDCLRINRYLYFVFEKKLQKSRPTNSIFSFKSKFKQLQSFSLKKLRIILMFFFNTIIYRKWHCKNLNFHAFNFYFTNSSKLLFVPYFRKTFPII